MTLEQLQEKKTTLENKYKEAEAQKQDLMAKANAIAQEQLRADGEYRLVLEMIKELEPKEEVKENKPE